MTALAAARQTDKQLLGELRRYPQAAVKIWKGSLVAINAAGFATPATDTTGLSVVGVAYKTYEAPSSAGDNDVEVQVGVFKFAATSITQAMLGENMYVVDDQTFDDTLGTNGIKAGRLVKFVSTTEGWLFIDGTSRGAGIVTADGSDAATTQALANAIKANLNLYG